MAHEHLTIPGDDSLEAETGLYGEDLENLLFLLRGEPQPDVLRAASAQVGHTAVEAASEEQPELL